VIVSRSAALETREPGWLEIVRRAWFMVFPRARRAVTWRDLAPWLMCLIGIGALCLFLEGSERILFANPRGFLLLLAIPWVWWQWLQGYGGLVGWRHSLSLWIRMSLVGLFAMLLAEPRSVKSSTELAVMYLLDISDSTGDRQVNQALRFIAETASLKPKQDSAGLVIFGKNAAVEFPARKPLVFEGSSITLNSLVDRDATNIEQGLSLAAAMLPEDKLGRIVLISDGIETEGDLAPLIEDLQSRGISIDVLPVEYDIRNEVWLERLELPQFVKQGETYEASVLLSALSSGKGTIRLQENGALIAEKEIDFEVGKNRYSFPIYLRNAGYYEYSAEIVVPPGRDALAQNNRVLNSLFLEGQGKVLVVHDPAGDPRDRQEVVRALQDGQRVVQIQSAYELPRDPLGLLEFDCILFCNVPADALDVPQMSAVHDAVFTSGVGFIMVGGNNSFGPGGYHRTLIEDALPVTMDIDQKKVLPKGALVLVLHTCEFPEGNTWAKRITREAIKVLGAQDEVAAIDYETGENWIFRLTPAGQYDKLSRLIEQAQPGDMPSFDRTMQMALAELSKSDAATKHVIIISDGDPQPPPPAVIQKFVDSQISVSTVAIYPHGGMEIGLLREVAKATGGRYYYPSDSNELPRIFIKEAKTLKRSMIQRKTVFPELLMPSGVLKGIEALPAIDGYVLTSPRREKEQLILQVPAESNSETEGPEYDPLLAIWQYGLGKTAAFTADLSSNWSSKWTAWDRFDAFVQQLVTEVSRSREKSNLRLWTYLNGSEGIIGVEDFAETESFREIRALVSGPQGRRQDVSLRQVGPRRYQAMVPLWGKGRYHVVAEPVGQATTNDRAFGGFIIPYSPEYLRFRSNPLVLDEVRSKTGGKSLELSGDLSPEEVARQVFPSQDQRIPRRSSQPIDDWFLIALACLVPLDVAIRRVQIDFQQVRNWLGLAGRAQSSGQTMGALLERKREVGSLLSGMSVDRPLAERDSRRDPSTSAPDSPRPPVKPSQTKPASPPQTGGEPGGDGGSTTERLLELKRRRQKNQ
jgi:uncharacterized membrane protein